MKRKIVLSRNYTRILLVLGENIKLARLRRKLSSEKVAERAGITRSTLNAIERGLPGVRVGAILNVLKVLGLERDFLKIANDDVLGRKLQDANLIVNKRAPQKEAKKSL